MWLIHCCCLASEADHCWIRWWLVLWPRSSKAHLLLFFSLQPHLPQYEFHLNIKIKLWAPFFIATFISDLPWSKFMKEYPLIYVRCMNFASIDWVRIREYAGEIILFTCMTWVLQSIDSKRLRSMQHEVSPWSSDSIVI